MKMISWTFEKEFDIRSLFYVAKHMGFLSSIGGRIFFLYFCLTFIPLTLVCALSVIVLAPFTPDRFSSKLRVFAFLWGRIGTLLTFSPVTVLHKEKAINSAAVLISNHQSPFDILVGLGHYPEEFLFFSKKEVFDVPFVGLAMKKLGYISVDRANARKAATSLITAVNKIKTGERVLIYPEGTRSYDAFSILKFKAGTLVVASRGQIPIQPIVIYGSQEVKPMKKKYFMRPHKIKIEILDAIDVSHELHPGNGSSKFSDQEKLEQLRQLVVDSHNRLAASA